MRTVRLATASILIDEEPSYPSCCIERCLEMIDKAGTAQADLVLLPEEPDVVGCTDEKLNDLPEPLPGGILYRQFAERANANRIYVAYSQRECDGDQVFNTGVLIDREGELVGKYRKMHLAPGEEGDVLPGNLGYPVFECDFGRVSIGICMDIHYPEMWRLFALKGADVLLFPTMCLDYTGDHIESIVNARAIDNQVYLVSSHFIQYPFLSGRSMGHSRIVDPYGRTLADTSHRPGLTFADVDLDAGFETWYSGELKERYPTLKDCYLGMRRPETYHELIALESDNPVWEIKERT
ncbi:carbon-nitrogen hydrolase family protein [Chloroflexi bacterium TSY]|nr:carbon-nitrogen hydrolase family protein [Chloroflexi bacterium TSY]